MAKAPGPGELARLSADLRIAIDAEGRSPQLVVMVFAEPTHEHESAVRVNEYESSERLERVIDAIAQATRPQVGEVDIDPYHPTRKKRQTPASKGRTRKASRQETTQE